MSEVSKEMHDAIERGYEKWYAGGCHETSCGCVTVYIERELAALAASAGATCGKTTGHGHECPRPNGHAGGRGPLEAGDTPQAGAQREGGPGLTDAQVVKIADDLLDKAADCWDIDGEYNARGIALFRLAVKAVLASPPSGEPGRDTSHIALAHSSYSGVQTGGVAMKSNVPSFDPTQDSGEHGAESKVTSAESPSARASIESGERLREALNRLTAAMHRPCCQWCASCCDDISEAVNSLAALVPAPSDGNESARLLTLEHCPWDVEQEDEGDPLPEPHCHANRDGDCTFKYCPQPLLKPRCSQIALAGYERGLETRTTPVTFSIAANPQDLSLSEQCCDSCGNAFFFLEAKDGDCSTQEVTFCPGCGRRALTGKEPKP